MLTHNSQLTFKVFKGHVRVRYERMRHTMTVSVCRLNVSCIADHNQFVLPSKKTKQIYTQLNAMPNAHEPLKIIQLSAFIVCVCDVYTELSIFM